MPTLFGWGHSALIYDIKKELWSLTAGYRRKFSYCWRFEPTSADSVRFNPLFEIRRGDNEVRDAQVIADILVDPDGAGAKWDHWQTTAHALLVGTILHVPPRDLRIGRRRHLRHPAPRRGPLRVRARPRVRRALRARERMTGATPTAMG